MKRIHNQSNEHSSSLHQQIRETGFVSVEEKGMIKYPRMKRYLERLHSFKNKSWQIPRLWMSQWDLPQAFAEAGLWVTEAFIEGFTANIATYYLFGVQIGIGMMLAHGIFIKQGLDIIWRVRGNGTHNKIQKKQDE